MANSVDSDQTASILNSSVMLGNYLQQTASADVIFQMLFLKPGPRIVLRSHVHTTDFPPHILITHLPNITSSQPCEIA